jgi:hypothetical protein
MTVSVEPESSGQTKEARQVDISINCGLKSHNFQFARLKWQVGRSGAGWPD